MSTQGSRHVVEPGPFHHQQQQPQQYSHQQSGQQQNVYHQPLLQRSIQNTVHNNHAADNYGQLGGGGESVQHNGDSQSGQSLARKPRPQNVVPMRVSDLICHREEEGPLMRNGKEVGFVKLVGQVCDFEETETRVTYRINDKTSSILLLQYKEVNNDVCDIQRGDIIGVIGSFKPGGQEKAVLVLKIWKISDENEIDFHSLTLVWNDLRDARMEQRRIFAAKNQNSGSFGLPMSGLQTRTQGFNEKVNMFGGMSTQMKPEATQFSFLDNMDKYVKDVLMAVRNNSSEEGLSHQELGTMLRLTNEKLNSGLNYLMEEGHIYCTIDDFHYKSTDV